MYPKHSNSVRRPSRDPPASTVPISSATIAHTTTTVPEMQPAPTASAVTAAQTATGTLGSYPQPPSGIRSTIEADRPRVYPPPPPLRTLSGISSANNAPQPGHDQYDGRSADMGHYENQHCRSNETHCPPPQYPDRSSQGQDPHDGLGYGTDYRGHQLKERSGGAHAFSKLKKQFNKAMSEPHRDTPPDPSYEDKTERYKRQRNELKDRCRELEDVNKVNRQIIDQLSYDLAKEQDRVDRTKRSANLLEAAMDNKEVFLGAQARNDDEVRQKFASILSSIKTWSNNFNAGSGHTFREDMMPEYLRVAPLCMKLQTLEQTVADKKRKRLFVRGWAAYIMTKSLFRTLDPLGDLGKDAWLNGGISNIFSRLENELWFSDRKLVTHRAFNDWRAFTADLLSKTLVGKTSAEENAMNAVQSAVYEVMDLVRPWCVTGDHDSLLAHEDRLRRIFIEAVQFAQYLRRQRALWSARFPSRPLLPGLQETGPLMFDPTSMKDDKGDDEDMNPEQLKLQYVDIVVTPALYKRGNTNGERFESEEAASPAIVVIRLA
ncbi:hypothetical protein P154DRAFT_580897 [Amniculicola lignicola CBS 123094]|uniref:Uncharacterized protein n=1 Tax=Amniculicola lignicola CBS 123094 TaxID=1392246 RepID=A0A6A5W291_9PLEO|nr:hypothetical protein P154DRAFT_580897 [Amniculicola lignicola CBS 123094]